ncbi:hypothetical protein DL89DRAFT_260103 [Linderina pennispora]|uniref:Uncharacterized protein n=1 Tax=Linderina pennispora TaxID=61395 RepID=A0A1Y1W029_9FUNG|nr:uncharacterized protein DL89DRAFT_260103 [Linderina pennispora]ORX66454.1 hypothetical protein DL89DRAFT_260103 [Linderina pennispora]
MSLSLPNAAFDHFSQTGEENATKKRLAEPSYGGAKGQKRQMYTVVLQSAQAPFLGVLNTVDPSGIMQLDEWNRQLAELVVHFQTRISELTLPPADEPQQLSDPARSMEIFSPKKSQAANHAESCAYIFIPSNACPSDKKHSVRRVYILDFPRISGKKAKPKKRLSTHGVNTAKILLSHPICPRVDEFFVESSYVNEFVTKVRSSGLTTLCTTDASKALCIAQRTSKPILSFQRYCSKFRTAYITLPKAAKGRCTRYLQDYAIEVGIKL